MINSGKEYYEGKMCISAENLTRDDRTEMDQSECLAPIMSYSNYKKYVQRGIITVVRQGKGKGNYALVDVASLPADLKSRVDAKYGAEVFDWLRKRFWEAYRLDSAARSYYIAALRERNLSLPVERIDALVDEYTRNASALNAIIALKEDTEPRRKAKQMHKLTWSELSSAAHYYKEAFGYTLGLTPTRLSEAVRKYQERGYDSLISRKFGNSNTLKVSVDVEELLLAIDADPHRPTQVAVWKWYCEFLAGERDYWHPETGHLYTPSDFPDLSEKTVGDVLQSLKNQAKRSMKHDTAHRYNSKYRPYHKRRSPNYSLSKISLDDRDLLTKVRYTQVKIKRVRGKEKEVKETIITALKVYLAYDVASQALIGWAFDGSKTARIFTRCVQNMFRNLQNLGLGCPHEAEVEHHIVSDFRDGFMADGALFPVVTFCAPGNSQQKRAEHFNHKMKYGYEKYALLNVGRHYAKSETNIPKLEKSFDEENVNYKQPVYEMADAIAIYEQIFADYNNDLHPDQKRYPGMTRLDVLSNRVHPEIQPIDEMLLARYIGRTIKTSIRRGMLTAGKREWSISSPHILDKLSPRDNEVEACWWERVEGQIDRVHIFQGGRYIDTCREIKAYQEAVLEQTEEDKRIIGQNIARVAQWDNVMREEKITEVGTMKSSTRQVIEKKPVKIVPLPLEDEEVVEVSQEGYYAKAQEVASRAFSDL